MSKQKRIGQPHVMPGFERADATEVMGVIDDPQLGEHDFPPKISAAINSFAHDAFRFAIKNLEPLRSLDRDQRLDFGGMLAYAAHMGFAMALYRYAKELKHVPELTAWHRKRQEGGNRGRTTQAIQKQERRSRVQAMLDQGMDVPAIARELKCSIATVYRALNQPAKNPSRRSQKR